MITVAEMKSHVTQLIETNRALAHDLDTSRRIVAERDRERHTAGGELAKMREQLASEQRAAQRMRRERKVLLHDAAAGKAQANRVQDQFRKLALRLRDLERERDALRGELDETSAAMDEILSCLQGNGESASWAMR